MNNRLMAIAVAAGIGAVGIGGVSAASALSGDSSSSSLVTKLAEKFNLKQSDVQAVFDANRSEHQAEQKADLSARLQKLVDAKTITAEQKTLIEKKVAEQQTAREAEHTALDKWASDNKIDTKYLMMGMGMGMGRGMMDGDDTDRLQTAVDNGELTAAQKKLIEDKQAELKTAREANKTALDKWASDNNIDVKYLMGGGRGGHGGGPRD